MRSPHLQRRPKRRKIRTRAKTPGAASKHRRRKPAAVPSVRRASGLARTRWLREERTLLEFLSQYCEDTPGWSLLGVERACELPYGTLKQMRYDPERRFRYANARSVSRLFGLPYIAAAYPNEPIGELVEWEERALAAPQVLT